MKRVSILISLILVFLFNTQIALAQNQVATDSATATSSSSTKVEYTFVYPGMLPDNPLYILKTIRDRAVSLLISDKLKRAEFDLLASDKRLVAATVLANKNKNELAVTTLSKSNNYMDQAISSLAAAKKAGQNIDTVLHNTQTSIKKHKEEVLKIQKSINGTYKNAVSSELERLQLLLNAANKLERKK